MGKNTACMAGGSRKGLSHRREDTCARYLKTETWSRDYWEKGTERDAYWWPMLRETVVLSRCVSQCLV